MANKTRIYWWRDGTVLESSPVAETTQAWWSRLSPADCICLLAGHGIGWELVIPCANSASSL